ncbi:hypothetical protein CerSpe_280080 [Prunus speciosa]
MDSTEGVMKVCKWRDALKEAANMAGFDNSNKTRTGANFIANVVEDILTKLNRKSSSDLKGLVGIEWKIEHHYALIHQMFSVQCLDKLAHLDLGECLNLKYLPQVPSNVEFLNLSKTTININVTLTAHELVDFF